MNRKTHKLVEKLKTEAQSFADYKTIEEKSAELGFPTSVRTLRFYVSEGILPPPRKRGKFPVYPQEWILSMLLAIHLMKTRFSRSLAEIKLILQGLAESPEILADKLTELYETVSGENHRLPAVEQRQLVDRFFATISGRTPARGKLAGLTQQPSQIVLPELLAGVPEESSGSSGSPEHAVRRDSRREKARYLESVFMRAFESGFRSLESVFHPGQRRSCPVRPQDLCPIIGDEYEKVARILIEHRLFDRDLFDSMPLNKSTRFELGFSRHAGSPGVVVVGVSWSPLEDLVRSGRSCRELSRGDLEAIVRRHTDGAAAGEFVYLGVHATSGFAPEVRAAPAAGANFSTALIEFDEDCGWRVQHSFAPEAASLASIFDPEPAGRKVERLMRRMTDLDALRVRGGFVDLKELEGQWGLHPAVLEEAVRRLQEADPRLEVSTVEGHRILKRVRHVV